MRGECAVCSYEVVRKRIEGHQRSVLLVGNGLSLSLAGKSFDWRNLRARVSAGGLSEIAKRAFEVSQADDFESAARVLHEAGALLKSHDLELSRLLEEETVRLCELTATAVVDAHPQGDGRPTDEQIASCARFLSDFRRVVTLNYDLLLYWVVNSENDACPLDGFSNCRPNDQFAVCWQGPDADPCVEYLHGALHLFVDGLETKKLRAGGASLIGQIEGRIRNRKFPLVVAGPTAKAKAAIIGRSPYLRSVLRRIEERSDAIVTFGWSAAPQDDHIAEAIVASDCELVCVGSYGLHGGMPEQGLANLARRLSKVGKEVVLFDTTAMNVWGK